MARFVALMRGINVGKAKRIAMADLRALMESLGYTDVKTLLNSGNVIFSARTAVSLNLAQRIQSAIATELGVDCLVIVKSAKEIAAVMADNPLPQGEVDPSRFLVAFTKDVASLRALHALEGEGWGVDTLRVGEHAAYLWCASGILESKCATVLLKGLAKSGTTRNWATMQKIYALTTEAA